MKKHSATKKAKPRFFDDIVANQDLWLPGLEYFFGRERGMHKLADYARPHFEKLLVKQRREAMKAIIKIKSDIQDQYNKELKDSRNKIAVETTGAFLKALVSKDNTDPKKVRGLKTQWYQTLPREILMTPASTHGRTSLAAATTLDNMMWGCVNIKEMVGHQPLTSIVNKAGSGRGMWWEDRDPLGGRQSNKTHF